MYTKNYPSSTTLLSNYFQKSPLRSNVPKTVLHATKFRYFIVQNLTVRYITNFEKFSIRHGFFLNIVIHNPPVMSVSFGNTIFFMTNSSSIYWLKSQQTVFVMFNRKAKSGRVSLGAIFPSQRHVQPDVACWELPCPRRGAPTLQKGHGEFTVWSDILSCLKQIKSPEIQ